MRTAAHGPLDRWVLSLVGLLVACPAAEAAPAPLQAEIVIDAAFDDWTEVLTNAANTASDGIGSEGCAESTDLDCGFIQAEADLRRFAWTWDATSLYLYLERHREVDAKKHLFVYVDANRSGRMETGEPVLYLEIAGIVPDNDLILDSYTATLPSGDSMTSPAGEGDGHSLPGTRPDTGVVLSRNTGFDPSTARWEGGVPWTALGLAPGAAVDLHVSSAKKKTPQGEILDNLAGPSGVVTTAFRALRTTGPQSIAAAPGTTVALWRDVANEGNVPARPNLATVSPAGLALSHARDADENGFAETPLAVDVDGDALFLSTGDSLHAAGDGNTDGRLDPGLLAPGESARLELLIDVPPGTDGLVETLRFAAVAAEDPDAHCASTDLLRVGGIVLLPDRQMLASPGGEAWIPHEVRNLGLGERVDLDWISAAGWPYALYDDPDGDGDPADAVALTDTDASGAPDLFVPGGAGRFIFVRASIPLASQPGDSDIVLVRALVGGQPVSLSVDRLEITEPLRLEPSHLAVDGNERHGAAGGHVYFPHRLLSALGSPASFVLDATSDLGWPVALLTDPDGDGRPFDAAPLTGPSPVLAANGGELPLLVRLTIPPGSSAGLATRLDVTATHVFDPSLSATAADDAVVALVRVYESELHVVNLRRFAPCTSVHAHAANLPPSTQDHRFAWIDSAGAVVRTQPLVPDGDGEASDRLDLGPLDGGLDWSVEIQVHDGFSWRVLDFASFDVRGSLAVSGGLVTPDPMPGAGGTLTASMLVLNESASSPVSALRHRWSVVAPDGREYLAADGSFRPYSGVEATNEELVSLGPREQQQLVLLVAGVRHPMPGRYWAQVWQATGCSGEEVLAAEVSYLVGDDADGDGLLWAEEEAAGTDPTDADSDDDGLPDGADGLGDSDLDGLIDALDCDSDGDGLPDGLESGVAAPGDDTDVAAGCFRADADPASVTDPDLADSDGGGVDDGAEDGDGDGALGAGETDPNDPADDGPACSPDPPRRSRGSG